MPQIVVNSSNIQSFGFSVNFDIANRLVIFDISKLTIFNSGGALNVLGVAFSLIDQQGVPLTSIDWNNPQIPHPSTDNEPVYSGESTFTLDLSGIVDYNFLFQSYQIQGAIKDQDGTVYYTTPITKQICQPVGFTDYGYVEGIFDVKVDCSNQLITVKELTKLVYNNLTPTSKVTNGTLYYPRGTVADIPFQSTPFSNNVVFTGIYQLSNVTTATYFLGDDTTVQIEYVTSASWDFDCEKHMVDVMCCVLDAQKEYQLNCSNARGAHIKQQLDQVTIPLLAGILKESNGKDASFEAKEIRRVLDCSCGKTSIKQVQPNPVNPNIYNIVITGAGGTSVVGSTVGNTKNFVITSNIYSIAKGNTGDLAFSIALNTSVPNNVQYVISFNYAVMANYILTAIGSDSTNTLQTQFNSLVWATANIDLSTLNGGCIINLSSVNYFLSLLVSSANAVVNNIVIGSVTHAAPPSLLVNNVAGIETWLNGLGLGSFEVSFTSNTLGNFYLNVLTTNNTNSPVSMNFTVNSSSVTIPFQKTNKSLIAFLQALVDYLCQLNTNQIELYRNLSLCQFDYNGNILTVTYPQGSPLDSYLYDQSFAICNIVNRINTLTGVTCAKIQSIFNDYPNASFSSSDRILSIVGGNCTSLSDYQLAQAVFNAVNKYAAIKTMFCNINCSELPTCPDVANISVNLAAGNAIGLYGLTWASTTSATQTVTVKYRIHGSPSWTISTTSLLIQPNGNISGTVPYIIVPSPGAGQTYDIQVINNCGGIGFITQITVPTSSVISGNYLIGNVIYTLCGLSAVTLYSSQIFAPGVTMYTDSGLTTPVTGNSLISPAGGNLIYTLGTSTGIVGSSTGSNCGAGIAGSYILGNDTTTICSGEPVTLYTAVAFGSGVTVYTDPSLTNPVTGYIYILPQ